MLEGFCVVTGVQPVAAVRVWRRRIAVGGARQAAAAAGAAACFCSAALCLQPGVEVFLGADIDTIGMKP